MSQIGHLVSAWRYPVKGMRGEEMDEIFVSYSGVFGDRIFAFSCTEAPEGFPFHTAREQEDLLLYRPSFRHGAKTVKPPNLAAATSIAPGITPVYPSRETFAVDVLKPDGRVVPIEDAGLLEELRQSRDDEGDVSLSYSERSITDCRPISIFSIASARQLAKELGRPMDVRRFRPNMLIDMDAGGFAENALVGKTIRVGDTVVLAILERDPRCKMIALDPETGDHEPRILQHVAQAHGGHAGVYAAVLTEGLARPGDAITLLS